jgi:hypothetical protein
VEAHLAGVLRAWGSALACVGGCIVGVAGLPASLVRADLKTARLLAKLLRRDPVAHVSLDNPYGVTRLLDILRRAGAEQQAAALAERLPGAGLFELFRKQEDRQDRFRFGREADGSPAGPWGWEDLN